MATLKRWSGSSWVTVPNGTALKYWNGSSWVNPMALKYWDGNSWETAWNKSDPITLTTTANFTTNIRYNGYSYGYDANASASNNTQANPMIGRYGGSYPYHFAGIIGFNMSAISAAYASRPRILSARINIERRAGSGLGTLSGASPIRIGTWKRGSWRALPSVSSTASFVDFNPMTSYDPNGWSSGTRWISIDPVHALDMINGWGLVLSEVTASFSSSGGTTNLYSRIGGIAVGVTPTLEVTLDY